MTTTVAVRDEATAAATLAELLDHEDLSVESAGAPRSLFQPIVELATGAVVGYEALSRGPEGSALESPVQMFEAARRAGVLSDLDRSCRDLALARAHESGVHPPLTVFLNVEPDTIEWPLPASRDATWTTAPENMRCCIELTERALTDRPAALLHAVSQIRDLSWGIALDDVGADARSLALMPFLRPDIIKLDLRLIQDRPSARVAEVVSAVAAQAEETGAAVLAEGIENESQLAHAFALGANLGQGYLFGRPGPLPPEIPSPGPQVRFLGGSLALSPPTPFDIVQAHQSPRRGTRSLLETMCRHIENQALAQGENAVAVTCDGFLAPDAAERLVRLAGQAALVGVIGADLDEPSASALRSVPMEPDDPLGAQWVLAAVGPHFAAALVARAVGRANDARDSQFEFMLTHDRQLVVECARALLARLPAA